MAKNSMIERERKRERLVKKYLNKRNELKKRINNPNTPVEERIQLVVALQKLPKNSSPVRLHNRCKISGRPHGYYRKFGLARNKLREATMRGDVPGLKKASW